MDIYLNNKVHQATEHDCITDVLASLQIAPGQKGVAIAVNNLVIPRTEWDMHELHTGDQVTVIKATQGG